jgi:5-methyltetrahydrofolate--homocysteine methyltransferase
MARTAERKLAIAARAFERATNVCMGSRRTDLLFDPLVLPISTGMESDRRSALETIEGVRRIMAEFPRARRPWASPTARSASSPPLASSSTPRSCTNCKRRGSPARSSTSARSCRENKIPDEQWARRDRPDLRPPREGNGFDPLQAFIALFKDVESAGTVKKEQKALTLEEQLRAHIIDGEKEGLESRPSMLRSQSTSPSTSSTITCSTA